MVEAATLTRISVHVLVSTAIFTHQYGFSPEQALHTSELLKISASHLVQANVQAVAVESTDLATYVSVQLWDVTTGRMIRQMQGHRSRVSSLSWNGNIVSSGSR